jgi:CBS domain-containing protein
MTLAKIARTDFPTFEVDSSISKMLGTLEKKGVSTAVVLKNKRFVGLVDRRMLFGSGFDPTTTKLVKCVRKTPTLEYDTEPNLALEKMSRVGLGYLPLIHENQVLGIVRAVDLAVLKLKEHGSFHKVHHVQLEHPPSLVATDKLGKALKIMQKERVDQVPVFAGRDLLGVVHDSALIQYLLAPPQKSSSARNQKTVGKSKAATVDSQPLASLSITPFMTTRALQTVTRETSLKDALMLMLRHSLSDVIVAENGRVFGMLTLRRIISYLDLLDDQEDITVQFVGISKTHLTTPELQRLKMIAKAEAAKLQRRIQKDEIHVSIRIKESHKGGAKHRYSVTTRVEAGGKPITSSQEDWKVEAALRKAFNSLGSYRKK